MPEKTSRELEKIEKRAEAFIEKVKQAPVRSYRVLGKEYRELNADAKRMLERINKNLDNAEEQTKKTWRNLAERTRKMVRKIEREWTSIVKEPKVAPLDP